MDRQQQSRWGRYTAGNRCTVGNRCTTQCYSSVSHHSSMHKEFGTGPYRYEKYCEKTGTVEVYRYQTQAEIQAALCLAISQIDNEG